MTADAGPRPVPCAVVTGGLGSGKTTAIRALMDRPSMAGTALVINEFGEVGLDHLLVSSAVETTLLMENGCMCCSLRGDLVDTLMGLFGAVERGECPPFHRILIETTGLADPVPIVRDLTTSELLRGRVRLSGVVTCVDGLIGRGGLNRDSVAVSQVAQADTCLVTKADLADPLALDQLCEALVAINPMMAIHRVREGELPQTDFLFSEADVVKTRGPLATQETAGAGHHHGHTASEPHAGVDSWSIVLDYSLPWASFRDWFDLVYSLNAARMLRMKGILWIEERDAPLLVQAVGPVVMPMRLMEKWPLGRPESRLVMIFKGLERDCLVRSFEESVLKPALSES